VFLKQFVCLLPPALCSGLLLKQFVLGLGGTAVLSLLALQLRGQLAEPFLGISAGASGSNLLGSFAASCLPELELMS